MTAKVATEAISQETARGATPIIDHALRTGTTVGVDLVAVP